MARQRILLVEGSPSEQQTIVNLMKPFNADVDVVASCPEAIKAARFHDYAVILADLNIKDILSGIKRMRDALNETPVVIFGANPAPEDADQSKKVGANEFVSKIPDKEEICRLLGRWLQRDEKWVD